MMKDRMDPLHWEAVLREGLPGEKAQLEMAPEFRGDYFHSCEPIPAAVLILMYPVEEEIQLVFMKRNAYDGPHSAQVSFPGGASEAGDASLEETALRETREELGIREEIRILGELTSLHIPVSNYQVTPFVAWTPGRPVFRPDPTEVEYLIEASLRDLMSPALRCEETVYRHDQEILIPYYRVKEEKIWGATAMMLCEFLQLATRTQSHRS